MRAGKLASLVLWVALTALAVGAGIGSAWLAGRPVELGSGLAWLAALSGAAFALILIPSGFLLDRSLDRLQAEIDRSARGDERGESVGAPRWLAPLACSVVGAVDRLRRREDHLLNQLRDLEVRHGVSEAERRQTDAVLNSLRDAVIVTDGFGEIVTVNQAAASLFDFDLAAAVHQPIEDVIGDERLCRLVSDTREASDPFERRHAPLQIGVPDGCGGATTRVFDVILACFEDHRFEVGGVVAVMRDQTHELEVSQMKSDFVSKASHELRTPLSSIRAYIEMLLDGEARDEAARQEFYSIIQAETDRLGRLIDNMLNISRIESGGMQIDHDAVDMPALIGRAVETIEPQARDKHITVTKRLTTEGLTVQGDADMLYQVVLNLLSNAVKYTPDGGRVSVAAEADKLARSVIVNVSDTGLGVPPDARPKLFDKFYRVENYKRVAKGTGLGLSLCKQIVETVHHGQIGVESKLGMGSKFWFSIPMRQSGTQIAA